ncbi:hypothetical protein [Novosphingobium sp. UBA1939]|uniref:hypothetical protein n=1 Tax=Novosphingobium sp. UBA1939 TaxID=1946982 RepID=UPI0025FE0DCF|nr:hypothetical protein [Novosphingobium sp. UBA1939]
MINKYADFPREIDSIAHALATACVTTLGEIIAQATPEGVLAAAEAQAREAGTGSPEAVRGALHACLMALEGIRQAIAEPAARVQIAPASPDTEGGEQ